MYKQYINDICHNCNPHSYDMTIAKFTGQENIVEIVGNPDASFAEYLYECCKCGTKVWVEESWVNNNPTIKTTIIEVSDVVKIETREFSADTIYIALSVQKQPILNPDVWTIIVDGLANSPQEAYGKIKKLEEKFRDY